jgi:hypothetical protein
MKRGERKQNLKPTNFRSKRQQLEEKRCGEKLASGNRVNKNAILFEFGRGATQRRRRCRLVAVASRHCRVHYDKGSASV